MDRDKLVRDVAETIRTAEVRAVALVLRSGNAPCLGQSVDYTLEPLPLTPTRRSRPYRVTVEQWHLDDAEQMLRKGEA